MPTMAGVRFSVKLAWARWALGWSAAILHLEAERRHTTVKLERLRILVGKLLRGVGGGVLDTAGLALGRGEERVIDIDEEGRGGSQENVAFGLC